ncbi:Serine/threonine protein kinase PRP4 [Mycena kentingensis (nom. inval.)]|nr:Serine/threonine protein kinase PRP4 [Mycena kentingensis (nom. inval.)]
MNLRDVVKRFGRDVRRVHQLFQLSRSRSRLRQRGRRYTAKKEKLFATPTIPQKILHLPGPEGYNGVHSGHVGSRALPGVREYRARAVYRRSSACVGGGRKVTGRALESGRWRRSKEAMHRDGLKEAAILNKLQAADSADRKHLVRLDWTFKHCGHLCLVFASLRMNLRDVLKRLGNDVGLNIRAVRAYAPQLFIALSRLCQLGVMHPDIKPVNILVNECKTLLKLCNLGSDAARNEEMILGVPYDPSLDIWFGGCTLYELYAGKKFSRDGATAICYMLLHIRKVSGEAGVGRERASKNNWITRDAIGKVCTQKTTRDLRARRIGVGAGRTSHKETHFVDLLDRCLARDSARRSNLRGRLDTGSSAARRSE